MKSPIYIERGSRIQYCPISRIISRDDNYTRYEITFVNGNIDVRKETNRQFDKWNRLLTENDLMRIIAEREKLQKEIDQLNELERLFNETLIEKVNENCE